jgi:XTP/dITP diphosphohydrolase
MSDGALPTVLVATRSAGKLRELVPMLAAAGYGAIDLTAAGLPEDAAAEDALEVADTFVENAVAKARYFAERSGWLTLADDSGLTCDALGGAPGVRSKRWSARPDLTGLALDAANNTLLLQSLDEAARRGHTSRVARYVCAAVWVDGARAVVAQGTTAGRILAQAAGDGGFGYDPLFWSDELGASFGAVSRDEKGRVSHRARAVAALLEKLRAGS